MKFYKVNVSWIECGIYYINAESEEDARELANGYNLPEETDYLEDSFSIDEVEEYASEEDWRKAYG